MKPFLNFLLLQNFKSEEIDIEAARPGARVYWQLTKMMKSFNPNFSQRKYWLYGCNCVMLGNNQISDPGYGPPLDELDTACKRHKDCLRCALIRHGNLCVKEFTKYDFGSSENGLCSTNPENTCKRALCECDQQFAKALAC